MAREVDREVRAGEHVVRAEEHLVRAGRAPGVPLLAQVCAVLGMVREVVARDVLDRHARRHLRLLRPLRVVRVAVADHARGRLDLAHLGKDGVVEPRVAVRDVRRRRLRPVASQLAPPDVAETPEAVAARERVFAAAVPVVALREQVARRVPRAAARARAHAGRVVLADAHVDFVACRLRPQDALPPVLGDLPPQPRLGDAHRHRRA